MAITQVDVIPGTRKSRINNLFQRTYAVSLRVEADAYPTFAEVRSAVDPVTGLSVPTIGAPWLLGSDSDTGSFCTSVDISEVDDTLGLVYEVALEYGPYDAQTFPANPMDWPLKVSTSVVYRERAVDFDANGDPIRNSAKQRFGDPVTREFADYVITCKRNEEIGAFSLSLAHDYQDSINDDTWNGFAAGVVLCKSITTGDEQYDSTAEVWYYEVTYVFETNRFTWAKELLDQGFCELDGSSPPKHKRILDTQGQPIDEAVPLNGSGVRLATNGTPVTLSFDMFEAKDFSIFNIDFAVRLGL